MKDENYCSRYYVSVSFDPNCIDEIKKFMLEHKFSVHFVSEVNLESTPVTSINVSFLDSTHHKLHCIANPNGKFLSREIFDFLEQYQNEIRSFQIGSLY